MRKWWIKREGEGGGDYLPCVITTGSTITMGLFAVCDDDDGEHHNQRHGKAAQRRVQPHEAALMEAQRLPGVCEKPQPEGGTAS